MLKAKPNYWGYNTTEGIVFQLCPAGYCCAGTHKKPCSSYDSCAGKRHGKLCSSCEAGFSQSLLSNTCMPNDKCTASWFWAFAAFTSLFYMLWYTFKDDIFHIPVKVFHKVKHVVASETAGQNIHKMTDHVARGYFGILLYFVQATVILRSGLSIYSSQTAQAFRRVETSIGLLLTTELSYMPIDICPMLNLNTMDKMLIKFLFFLSIFGCWIGVYAICLCAELLTNMVREVSFTGIKVTLVGGLVKIIKYSFGGLAKIVFFSLVCVDINSRSVWFYDASVNCFSSWQLTMTFFGVVYVIPFPFTLLLGLKCLKRRRISSKMLLAGTFCPLLFLCIWFVLLLKAQVNPQRRSYYLDGEGQKGNTSQHEDERILYEIFTRGYRPEGGAQYWECVMFLRRLLLNIAALVPDTIARHGAFLMLSILYLMHHIYMQPFVNPPSNRVESVSLFFLCIAASSNLVKAIYVDFGVLPSKSHYDVIGHLSFLETLFLPSLLLAIVMFEVHNARHRGRCRVA